jgi:hypothetical protein
MIATILSITLLLGPPEPGDGEPLPWPVPIFPSITTSSVPALDLAEAAHSEDYEEQVEETEEMVETWTGPMTTVNDTLESWIVEIPEDAQEGDFDSGMTELGSSTYDTAESLGTEIGTVFSYVRTLRGITTGGVGTFFDVLLICIALLILVNLFIFVVQVTDMLISLFLQGIQALGEALPFPW